MSLDVQQDDDHNDYEVLCENGASHCFIKEELAEKLSQQLAIPIQQSGHMRVRQAAKIDDRRPRRRITLPIKLDGQMEDTITFTL